jgi:hypothetical protein
MGPTGSSRRHLRLFGSLDHDLVIDILAAKIHYGRLLWLIDQMLKAGYLEDWRWHATLSGAAASPPPSCRTSTLIGSISLSNNDS